MYITAHVCSKPVEGLAFSPTVWIRPRRLPLSRRSRLSIKRGCFQHGGKDSSEHYINIYQPDYDAVLPQKPHRTTTVPARCLSRQDQASSLAMYAGLSRQRTTKMRALSSTTCKGNHREAEAFWNTKLHDYESPRNANRQCYGNRKVF